MLLLVKVADFSDPSHPPQGKNRLFALKVR